MSNSIRVIFKPGVSSAYAENHASQYDYGQVLEICGIELPDGFEADFCNERDTDTITVRGSGNRVAIPDECLNTGRNVYVYVFLHDGADGRTAYRILIPVWSRPKRPSDSPQPSYGILDVTLVKDFILV